MILPLKVFFFFFNQKVHYFGGGGLPGSIQTLKKYTLFYVTINMKSFFLMENLDFEILVPRPWNPGA